MLGLLYAAKKGPAVMDFRGVQHARIENMIFSHAKPLVAASPKYRELRESGAGIAGIELGVRIGKMGVVQGITCKKRVGSREIMVHAKLAVVVTNRRFSLKGVAVATGDSRFVRKWELSDPRCND